MDNRYSEDVPATYPEHRRPASQSKAIKIIIITALVLLAGLWIWKALQMAGIKKEAREENERVRQTAVNMINQTREEQLRLMAKPLAWAIRAEMMRGNMEGVNLYLSDMVREKNFQRIEIADTKGVIIASTDKKNEGQPVTGAQTALTSDSTLVESRGDSTWFISSPIMGFNNRLGTLLINYANERPNL